MDYTRNMPSVQGSWFLRGFERSGDQLLSERPLTGVDASILAEFIREHWDRPEDDLLVYCLSYPVTSDIPEALREQVGIEANLDFSREEYFLEFNA